MRQSHPWRYARPLPAIAALLLGLGVVLWQAQGPGGYDAWYSQRADQSFAAADYRQAAVCYARLLANHPDQQAIAFQLARSLKGLGQNEAATSLLATIAPLDAVGYAPAQIMLAQQMLNEPKPSPNRLDLARRHLMEGLTALPDDPQANALMALVLANMNQWQFVDAYTQKSGSLREQVRQRLDQIKIASTQSTR